MCLLTKAQSISPVVINANGGYLQNGTISVSYSVGEPAIITLGPFGGYFLTQGFQQPSYAPTAIMTANLFASNTSCQGAGDGSATIQVFSGTPPYNYSWSFNPLLNTNTINNVPPGKYYVTVSDAAGSTYNDSLTIAEGTGLCGIRVYKGITPNSDASNDTWIIDNIDLYPENQISIFNRWGEMVWSRKGYNNTTVVWAGENESGGALPDATYFYVIKTSRGSKTGWVELTR
jgi:gliding motility-associated-like protein